MKRKTTQRLYYVFGISMAVLMAVTLVLPAFQPDPTIDPAVVNTPLPTDIPIPTFPPPLTDFSGISFDDDYLHSSGLFTVGIPTGWTPNAPVNTTAQAQVNMSNPDAVSVIEAYVLDPNVDNPTLDDVSARFDQNFLQNSWRQYQTFNELDRRQENDRVLIDFSLTRSGQNFLARHAAWTDGDWIYAARVVVPQNASQLMFYLLDGMIASMEKNEQFVDTPLGWAGFYDEENHHIIRYPQTWQLTDGGSGLPSSFLSDDGTLVRVEADSETTISTEDEASAYVEAFRSGITVDSVEMTSRVGGEGYVAQYTYSTPDGESRQGQAVLLNGEDGQLHIANALLPIGASISGEDEVASDVQTALDTFSLLLGLNLPQPEPEIEPTSLPVEAESTPEMTAEPATDAVESTPETTPEESIESGESVSDETEEAPSDAGEPSPEVTEEG